MKLALIFATLCVVTVTTSKVNRYTNVIDCGILMKNYSVVIYFLYTKKWLIIMLFCHWCIFYIYRTAWCKDKWVYSWKINLPIDIDVLSLFNFIEKYRNWRDNTHRSHSCSWRKDIESDISVVSRVSRGLDYPNYNNPTKWQLSRSLHWWSQWIVVN